MSWKNTHERYGSVSITMHWLMVILLAGVYACIELSKLFPAGSGTREVLMAWHFALGLGIVVLVVLRLMANFFTGAPPPIEPPLPPRHQNFAWASQIALLIFLLVMPLLGWVMLDARGVQVSFLGLRLPTLAGTDMQFAEQLREAHRNFGIFGYYLVALHAAAALVHHYMLRDNTLLRILPERKHRRTPRRGIGGNPDAS